MSSGYLEAGNLLTQVLEKRQGLKSIVFEGTNKKGGKGKGKKNGMKCSKASYATVCHTLECKSIIDEILDLNKSELRRAILEKSRNIGVAYVLLHELLFSKYQSIRGGGAVKRVIIKQEDKLRKGKLAVCGVDEKITGSGSNRPVFPRYVRVNNLFKIETAEVARMLNETLGSEDEPKESDDAVDKENQVKKVVYADPHVPDLLVLPPKTELYSHELVTEGKIILQDKSSCFSALALIKGGGDDGYWKNNSLSSDAKRCDVLDACAAPGNKTTHLASLLDLELRKETPGNETDKKDGNKKKKQKKAKALEKSKVFALDRDSKRIKILQKRVEHLVPDNHNEEITTESPLVEVVPIHTDFLQLEPGDSRLGNLKAILLDPSCSGSGIVSQPDRLIMHEAENEEDDTKRMTALSNFQLVALKHAMSFPQVDRIVYSTCSINDIENEHVVATALKEFNDEIKKDGCDDNVWQLVTPACLTHWKRRGKVTEGLTKEQAECLIRCDAHDGDNTNGFFVSYFERKRVSSNNTGSLEGCPKAADTLTSCADIPMYNNEYKDISNTKNEVLRPTLPKAAADSATDNSNKPKSSAHTKKSGSETKENPKKDKPSSANSDDDTKDSKKEDKLSSANSKIHLKKKAKKMKWKQKQKEQKLKRIKQKELAAAKVSGTQDSDDAKEIKSSE